MRESTNKISDPKIAMHVTQRIAGRGIRSPSHVTVVSAGGQVTLKGTIQHQHQRQLILQAIRGIGGVKGVVDSLTLLPQPKRKEEKKSDAGNGQSEQSASASSVARTFARN